MLIPNLVKYSTAAFTASNYVALDYFTQYDNSSSVTTDLPNFGLKSEYTWDGLVADLTARNAASNDEKYKIIFFARHGEGWHNYLIARVDDWDEISRYDTYENYTLFDADLTPTGVQQAENVGKYWDKELAQADGVPYPDLFYVSPLRRTIHTFHATWPNVDTPIIDEDLRERCTEQTPEERHNKTWIENYCPTCSFLPGFAEEDPLWTPTYMEKESHVRSRDRSWLNTVFERDELVISVTTHSGYIKEMLEVIDHPAHPLYPAQLIPVVIKATT